MKTAYNKLIISCTAGNILELYNFILFSYFSKVLSSLFFPKFDAYAALMLTFGVFATGCLMRPLGAIFFGFVGDKFGRRKIVIFCLTIMTASTTLIGFLPTYHEIGISASILLLLCRLCQGFSMSGEETGAAILLSELLPKNRQALAGSIILGSVYIGLCLGSVISLLLIAFLSAEQLHSWGWRVPFIISFFLGLICIILRLQQMKESAEFMVAKEQQLLAKNPVLEVLKSYKKETINCMFTAGTLAVAIYLFAVFVPNYFNTIFNFKISMLISSSYFLLVAFLVIVVGLWADRVGYKKPMLLSCIGFILFSYPIFFLFSTHNVTATLVAELMLAILISLNAGSLMPILVNSFPTRVRLSGVGIAFNFSMTIFGSTAPLLALYLTKLTGSENAPFIYLTAMSLLTLYSMYSGKRFKDGYQQNLVAD